MNTKRIFPIGCLLGILLLGTQCRDVKTIDIQQQARYHITPLEYHIIDYSDVQNIIDTVKIINLEFTEEALMHNIVKILTLDNGDFIVTDKKKICHFSADGKHIRNYGMRGRGPQEHIALEDICINNADNTLLILDAMNKILFFSTESGKFIKAVSADWGKNGNTHRLDAIIPADNGGFFIASANTTLLKPGNEFYCITEFDSEGKKISEGLPTTDFVYMNSMTSQSYGNRYLIKPIDTGNIAYETEGSTIKPLCWIDFGDKNVEAGAAFMPDGEMLFSKLIETNSYKLPMSFAETPKHITFTTAGPKGKAYGYIYNKTSDNGYCIASPDHMTIPISFFCADRNYFYTALHVYSANGIEQHADPITRYITEQYGVLGENDNQRIIGVKFK